MSSREDDDWLMVEAPPVVEPNAQSESDELEDENDYDEDDEQNESDELEEENDYEEDEEQSDSSATPEPVTSQSAPPSAEPVAPVPSEQLATSEDDSDLRGHLAPNQRREIRSELVGDIHITFDTQDEKMRAQSRLPRNFYRTFYETSATLSSYVTVDTHMKHRKRTDLKMDYRNAFQAIGEFSINRGMNQAAIKRHLVWNQKKIPSTFISAFDSLRYAMRRARFHSEKSQRIGQRVSVAKIDTSNLIPATIRGLCKSTISVFTKYRRFLRSEKSKEYTKQVEIPVWIHKKAREQYGSKITPQQWKESGADMWMSITELRLSNIRTVHPKILGERDAIIGKGHDYEWLCCGAIPKSLVVDVWPWDGKRLYTKDPGRPIRSFKNSGQTWVWHWEKKMWLPDVLSASTTVAQVEQPITKRQRIDDAASQDKDKIAEWEGSMTHQPLSMSIIQPIVEVHPGDPTFTYTPKTCPKCNHPTERILVVKPPRWHGGL